MNDHDLTVMLADVRALGRIVGADLQRWRYVLECANSIWQRCPFRVGDRVRLTRTPVINDETSWGWMPAKHFLVAGATATVVERKFYEGSFTFGLEFDDETWIDHRGQKQKPKEHAVYMFRETWLAPADAAWTVVSGAEAAT